LVGGPSLSLENGGVELLAFPAGRRDVLELLGRALMVDTRHRATKTVRQPQQFVIGFVRFASRCLEVCVVLN